MDEIFSPKMSIEGYLSRKSITLDDIGVAPIAIASWDREVIKSLAREMNATSARNWPYIDRQLFYTGSYEGMNFSLVELPVGAPATVLIMEEMIACGVEIFLALGWAGSLQHTISIGAFIIPTSCIREEGTSFHYFDENVSLAPDNELVDLLESVITGKGTNVFKGPQWTIDAIYRELKWKVNMYRDQGVLGVDMETSAMYALAQYRDIRICNLLVVSDILGDKWEDGSGSDKLIESRHVAVKVLVECLISGKLLVH